VSGVAIVLGLYAREKRLQVGLLRIENSEAVDLPELGGDGSKNDSRCVLLSGTHKIISRSHGRHGRTI
jgi:hypothetical protein